mmetsp:Transcript_3724/g.9599  ORF Transcript_3724/g.9599 Transcript_3724/m.9599 type:complete len:665 (+) Transcript_3724:128-2122(+)
MSCWSRYGRDDDQTLKENFLTQQLKFAREQIDKKSRLNDELSGELRRLQAELEIRSVAVREAHSKARAQAAEIRAAAHAVQAERSEVASLRAALRDGDTSHSEATDCRSSGPDIFGDMEVSGDRALQQQYSNGAIHDEDFSVLSTASSCSHQVATTALEGRVKSAETRAIAAEAVAETSLRRANELETAAVAAAARIAELEAEVEALRRESWEASEREAALATEKSRLQAALVTEKELHEEAVRLMRAQRANVPETSAELRQELKEVSATLTEKEEEILSIQFDMVSLQNRMADQIKLVTENANAFQSAAEELADKDELLEKAGQKQEELHAQMKEISVSLRAKVARLTQELDGTRLSYQTLEEHSKAAVARLEADRDALSDELERTRTEAKRELVKLRAELQRREVAAAEARATLESELNMARSDVERDVRELGIRMGFEKGAEPVTEQRGGPSRPGELRLNKLPGVRRDAALAQESARYAAKRCQTIEERLAICTEKLSATEEQNRDLSMALETSRLLERQAMERVKEYLADLEYIRGNGTAAESRFQAAAPRQKRVPNESTWSVQDSTPTSPTTPELQQVPAVLMSVTIDLGMGKMATLSIAPWHTRSDFDDVVRAFLNEHNVRPIFSASIVRYLEEVENQAAVFPAKAVASLSELYSRFG